MICQSFSSSGFWHPALLQDVARCQILQPDGGDDVRKADQETEWFVRYYREDFTLHKQCA